jgi:hypothetical protein
VAQQQPPVRWRKPFVVLTIALVASGAGAVGVAAGHYKLGWLNIVAVVCFVSAILLATVLSFSAPKILRRVVIVGVTVVAVVALLAVLGRTVALEGPRKVTSVVTSADGRYELVVEEYNVIIDPAWDVWLRETEGLFARKVLVWTSREGPAPGRVAFVGPNEIEIRASTGDVSRSTFDPATLQPSKVHCVGPWCKE